MPCFNTKEEIHNLTKMAVESIREAGEVELIIVDNGSTFAPGYLKSVADIYIKNEENLGYPHAVNQGLKIGTGDVFCISNNDVRVSENIFKVGLEILKDTKIGSVHFKMIPYDHEFRFGDKLWKTGKERWCTSSFFLIKREALPKGYYDTKFGAGSYDDYDFWYRVRQNGWLTAYTNKSAYQHWGSHTFQDMGNRSEIDKRNLQYFFDKWGKQPEQLFSEQYPEQWQINYLKGFE